MNNCIKDKEKNPNETNNFDAVLIDEGQDFKEEWFKFIRLFLTENQEALIAIDEKQNVYGREKMKLKGVGSGKWGILKKGYRLNNLHSKIANDFSKRSSDFLKIEGFFQKIVRLFGMPCQKNV